MNTTNAGHSGADVLAPDANLRAPKRALPRGTVREPLFATNAAKLYRLEDL